MDKRCYMVSSFEPTLLLLSPPPYPQYVETNRSKCCPPTLLGAIPIRPCAGSSAGTPGESGAPVKVSRMRRMPLPIRDGLNPSRIAAPGRRGDAPTRAWDLLAGAIAGQTHRHPDDDEAAVAKRFADRLVVRANSVPYSPDDLVKPGAEMWTTLWSSTSRRFWQRCRAADTLRKLLWFACGGSWVIRSWFPRIASTG